uniref:DUF748 domain-containing protein n=1 Tax=Candidatus Electronema sp. TaxID=2698783 RepID=UPI004057A273
MTDEKKNPAGAGAPDFGEIQITGGAAPHRPAARSAASASKPPKAAAPPEKKSTRQSKAPRSGGRGRLCLVLLLLLPPALLLLWLAGAFYLLPLYVQGPLAEKVSRQLGRPVTVGQASLSPFKLLLRLNEITVGPAAAHPDERELARIDSIAAQLRPAALLKGQIALDDVRIDRLRADLLRRQDGSFNALPPGSGLFGGLNVFPDWLRVNSLRLSRSTAHFFDQPSGKKHLVEHIEFVLPPAGQGLDPSLSAVVNSSPLQLIGQRQEDDSGPETRLTLKLDNLDPQQYLGLFPELAKSLSLSAARADAVLEISLRDKGESGKGLNATASVTFSSLLAQSADYEEQPKQAFRLTSPTAHVIVRGNPLQQHYIVEELLLEEPQLDLPSSMAGLLDGSALAVKAAALLNPAEIGLAVGKLTLSKGQVRSGGQEWTDVQLELSGFENLKATAQGKNSDPARLSLSASNGKSALSFTGAADPAFSLNGSLSLQNTQADFFRPFLSADEGLRFTKGGADISGELRLEQRADGSPSLTITGGAVALRDFTLQQKKAVLLSAKSLHSADCILDGAARSVSCGTTALDGADFADTGFFLPSGKRGRLYFSSSTLELKNSSARLQFGPASLPLSGLSLSLQADSGLKLTAAAGKQGSIEINGAAAKGKDGAVALSGKLSLKNVSADLLHPYLTQGGELRFKQGGADVSGSFSLNGAALSFADSAVTLRNFTLQRGEAVLLSGKAASGLDCALNGVARSMSCGKIALDGADFADSGFFLRPAGRLRLSAKTLELKDSSAKLPLGAAMLPLSSLKMSLSGLTQKQPGQISLEAASSGGRLEISGAAVKEESGIALSGTLTLRNVGPEILQPYFGDGIVFSKGGADLSGTFKTSGSALHLSNGAVTLRDFSLQRGGAALISGRTAHGADCALDGGAKSMNCGKITVDGADFADSGFFLRPAGRLRLSANALELKDSAAKLPFGAAMLPLSGLKMSLGGLPGPVSLEAAAGSGRLEISGEAAKSEAGLALSGQLSLKDAGAEILQPYFGEGISPAKGGADISGGFRLSPAEGGSALHLSNGAVTLRDFSLQRGGTALISGRSAHGSDCALDGAAKSMSCGKITLDGADFADSGFFLRPAGRLRLSANALELKDSSAKLPLGAAILPLSGLKMSLGGLPGPVSLEAAAGSGRLAVSGEAEKTESGLSLGGSVLLRNADASLLNPYLGDELHFSRGRAELSGAGRLSAGADGGAALHLTSGAVTVQDFSLERGGAALVSGKAANGADCVLDGATRSMSCGSIALDGADFAADAPGFFFRSGGKLRFAADAVEISGSSGLLPVGQAMLPLSGLKMSLSGLRGPQPPQNNFRFAAAAGQGSLKAEGQLRRDGSGAAELTAERLDIRLFSKAFASLFRDSLSLKQGSLSAKGEFRLPESRFSGSLSVDSFAAETNQGDSLHWRRAATDKATLVLSPFAASAEKLAVEEPQLQLAAVNSSLPAAFFGLFTELPQIAVEQCNLNGGSLQRGGSKFSGIQGQIGPIKTGTAAAFSFTGKMGGSDFAASGKTDTASAIIDKLTVERLPLEKTGQLLAKELGLDSSRGRVTRSVSADGDRLDFSGFVPLPKSDYAFALALLTDKDGGFSMPLQSVPFSATDEVIVKAAADMLQKLRDTSPWTALEKLVPNLPKAQNIDFLPGDKVPDFMEGIDGLRTLFSSRPHLGWTVKGCYDQEADRKGLLAQAQKKGGQKVEEENARRKQELDRLLAQEVLRQMTLNKAGLPIVKDLLPEIKAREDLQPLAARQDALPEHVLPDLANARAEVVRQQLVGRLNLPTERVRIEESAACGAKVELLPVPVW